MLAELAQNPDRVLTREELYARVWKRAYRKSDRSVDVYVGRLRSKLERALPGQRFIHTHTGIGYRLLAGFLIAAIHILFTSGPQPRNKLTVRA